MRSLIIGAVASKAARPPMIPAGRPNENRLSAGAERLSSPASTWISSRVSVTGSAIITAVANIVEAKPSTTPRRGADSTAEPSTCPGGKAS
jgi:hypothetical protein